jgi:hypothetical protein
LKADDMWTDEEILTHMAFGQRLKVKLQADAWLQATFRRGFILPLFHFEHQRIAEDGQARRKAILESQLSWRRLFLAASHTARAERQQQHQKTEQSVLDELKNANDKCQNVLFWYASLQGKYFAVGALKGVYDVNKSTKTFWEGGVVIESRVQFVCVESTSIDIYAEGDLAVNLMYALSMYLPDYFSSLPTFLDKITTETIKPIQDYTQAVSGSK